MLATPTACPFCSCGCGFYLLAREGQLIGVAPSETHPVSKGRLCARGWSAHEAASWGDRLRQPLLRRNGKQESVPWDEALDHIATRFKELMDAGKPVGVLGSSRATNEENYLAGKLARAGLQTNNVDFSYDAICSPLFAGIEEACGKYAPSIGVDDIASSQVILLTEGNLAETHPRVAGSVLKALDHGARLITIGCKKTQMARLASLHLQALPGTEGDVINGLLAAVLDLGLQDRTAVTNGYAALRRNLEAVRTTEEVRQVAEWIAHAERMAFLIAPSCGPSEQSQRAAAAFTKLAAITGHLNKPGSGLLPLLARSNVRGARDMAVVPDRLPGCDRLDDTKSRQRVEDLWGRKLPSASGMSAEKLLQSVSGLIVVADDPPSIVQIGQRAMTAMEEIEFLVVLDAFATPSARIAHVSLPIAGFAETEGTFTNMEGRVQRLSAVTSPPGEARAGWQVLAELCARFNAVASYGSASDVLREIGQAAPRYAGMERKLSKDGWGGVLLEDFERPKFVAPSPRPAAAPLTSAERPFLLVRDGAYDWGRDPLVWFSPTLKRDYQSERKFFPNGFVEISKADAVALNLNGGRQIRLTSVHGKTVVPVRVRTDLKQGLLFVPYAFRDCLANVLGTDGLTAVTAERA